MVQSKIKERPSKETWYDGSIGGQLLFKARTQSLELNARTYRWSKNCKKLYRNCNLGADETVLHVIVECPKYERDRAEVIRIATEAIGIEGWRVIRECRSWHSLHVGTRKGTCEVCT